MPLHNSRRRYHRYTALKNSPPFQGGDRTNRRPDLSLSKGSGDLFRGGSDNSIRGGFGHQRPTVPSDPPPEPPLLELLHGAPAVSSLIKEESFAQQSPASNIQRSTFNTQRPPAFTLIEVLLAVALTGFVLAAASTMLVSVTNIWANRLESNFFEDHIDGVAEFVQSTFTRAGMEIALGDSDTSPAPSGDNPQNPQNPQNVDPMPEVSLRVSQNPARSNARAGRGSKSTTSALLRMSDAPIAWAQPPGFAGYREPLLNFKLREPPPLLVNTDNAPVTGINAFLYFDRDEGLSLLWYSLLQEEVDSENDLRRTQLSPFVTEIRYIYWDERFERWEEETEPQKGEADEYLLPRFIKLIFKKDELTQERTISIPVPSRSAILF